MAKKQRRYSPEERAKMLATAERDGLTGIQAAKKFHISTVTYYAWKKTGGASRRGTGVARRGRPAKGGALLEMLRDEVRKSVRELLPGYLARELSVSVADVMGAPRRGRPRGVRRAR